MKKIHLTLVFFSAMTLLSAQTNEKITGAWSGALKMPAMSLNLVFHFSSNNGKPETKLDVPAQGAKGLAASKTVIGKDSVSVEFAMMHATFKGLYKADSACISGSWKQNNFEFPLKLVSGAAAAETVKHPQEPVKPYPYHEEEVTFKNEKANITLAGTLTWPENKSKCPVVVLVTGSGPQDRDETVLGQKPFLVLSDYLTRRGIAVLRYDDRGVGKSTGEFKSATTFDFATDAEAAVQYLKTRTEIDPAKIGILGHSEGGLIAPMVASQSHDVAFIVLLAGPGLKGGELLIKQNEALAALAGMDKEHIEQAETLNRKIYALAVSNSPNAESSISSMLQISGMTSSSAKMQAGILLSPWYRTFLSLDPAVYLKKVTCPVLALNGKKDVQVVYSGNLKAIDKALSDNKQHKTKAYDDLNHLFQHCHTCTVEEYGTLEETMSPEVLKDLGDWMLQR